MVYAVMVEPGGVDWDLRMLDPYWNLCRDSAA